MTLSPHGTHNGPREGTAQRKSSCALLSCFMLVQGLCAAAVSPDVLQTMALVFSGADVMCATGDPTYSTPYLLAQRAGQKLQMEFLHQNKLSGKQLWVLAPVKLHVAQHMCTLHVTVADLTLKIHVNYSHRSHRCKLRCKL